MYDQALGTGGKGFRPSIELMYSRQVPVFFYPHSARPMVQWDGIYQQWPHIRAEFVPAEGHKRVVQAYGYPVEIIVVGWQFCDIVEFRPVEKVENILFGPIHPNANGWLSDIDKGINREAHDRLVKYCRETGAKLTVRHIHGLDANGITRTDGKVTYIHAMPNGRTDEIDAADVVVGHQTFAYMAVARGKPTLMMREDIPPRSGNAECNFTFVSSFNKYADLLMYPLDLLCGETHEMIERAANSDADIKEWRKNFIGEPFCAEYFVEQLEARL